jgi:hypothetical protein
MVAFSTYPLGTAVVAVVGLWRCLLELDMAPSMGAGFALQQVQARLRAQKVATWTCKQGKVLTQKGVLEATSW